MIDEQALPEAARAVEEAILRAVPTEEHSFSPRFLRRMNRLLRRANMPGLYRVLRTAVCAALTVLIAGALVIALHTEARAKALGWLYRQYENVVEYFFIGEPQSETDPVAGGYPHWLPKGYQEYKRSENESRTTIIYKNEVRNLIMYSVSEGSVGRGAFLIVGEAHAVDVVIKGNQGICYVDPNDDGHNSITWESEDGRYLYMITGYLTVDELVKIAESVKNP